MADPIKGCIAVTEDSYKAMLADKVKELFKNKDSITREKLMADKSIYKIYNELSEEAKSRFDYILSLEDSDSNNVTEKEYKTLLCVLDAKVCHIRANDTIFEFDQENSLDNSGGINVTDKEYGKDVKRVINIIYNMVTSRKEIAKELKEEKEQAKILAKEEKELEKEYKAENKKREKEQKITDRQNFNYLKNHINEFNFDNDSDKIKGLHLLHSHQVKNKKLKDLVLKSIFGDTLKRETILRDGGTRIYELNDGTVIKFDNKYKSPTNGLVAIEKDGKSVWYNTDGNEVKK